MGKNLFFFASLKPLQKGVGSGTIGPRYGSADPDPHQNVTDPQHCVQYRAIEVGIDWAVAVSLSKRTLGTTLLPAAGGGGGGAPTPEPSEEVEGPGSLQSRSGGGRGSGTGSFTGNELHKNYFLSWLIKCSGTLTFWYGSGSLELDLFTEYGGSGSYVVFCLSFSAYFLL